MSERINVIYTLDETLDYLIGDDGDASVSLLVYGWILITLDDEFPARRRLRIESNTKEEDDHV